MKRFKSSTFANRRDMVSGRPTTLCTGCCIGSISTFMQITLLQAGEVVNPATAKVGVLNLET